jgi:hypothetical protein
VAGFCVHVMNLRVLYKTGNFLTQDLLVCQEEFCSMKLVSQSVMLT